MQRRPLTETSFFISMSCALGILQQHPDVPIEVREIYKKAAAMLETKDLTAAYELKDLARTQCWKHLHDPRKSPLVDSLMMVLDALDCVHSSKAMAPPRKKATSGKKA